LEDALSMKTKPFPRPWREIKPPGTVERVGVGNIGAELDFVGGIVDSEGQPVSARIVFFNHHKDVVGPVRTYWYVMWHQSFGYIEFDIRWIWEFLGESEPTSWSTFTKEGFTEYILGRLGSVSDTFSGCPENRRCELMNKILNGKFDPPMPACNPAESDKNDHDLDEIPF